MSPIRLITRTATIICLDGKGEPLVVRGRVTDTSGAPIAGATVDAWQTNEDGFYDVQQKGVQPEMNLRGIFTTDDEGRVLVSLGQAALVSDPRRRPGRGDARSDGPQQSFARPTSTSSSARPDLMTS